MKKVQSSKYLVRVQEFHANARDITFEVDDGLNYLPDPAWSKTMGDGLGILQAQGYFSNKRVFELGVGTGINLFGLMTSPFPPAESFGSDINPHSVDATRQVAEKENIPLTLLSANLLTNVSPRLLRDMDVIFGCLPQVPKSGILTHRERADYASPTRLKEDRWGFGYQATVLDQLNAAGSNADALLLLAGRAGDERRDNLFKERGYTSEIVYQRVVRQDRDTSLASYATIEKKGGLKFCFYRDAEGTDKISARTAHGLRKQGVDVYHDLYLVRGYKPQ